MAGNKMSDAILEPEEDVLSTLNKDGSRRWIKPKLTKGRFYRRRQQLAYLLIGIFTLLPIIKINGKQAIFLEVAKREFTFFGFTFYPTDTILLAIFLVGVLVSIFLITSLFGRLWCGWACPQTVYMEFVFRPIERFFDGTAGRGGKPRKPLSDFKTVLKYLVYFLICFYLSNTFLAYFVGSATLWNWMHQSPIHHPLPFLFVLTVSFFMMYNFCFFREQLCILACPYGRFQSVLLDDQSMIVAYDINRGEPKHRLDKKAEESIKTSGTLPVLNFGDCVDCHRCVTVCPTGIDIRDGLQMECVNCTQCMDACDEVMHKIGRQPGLIRYSSKAIDEGKAKKLLRARSVIYPVLLLGLLTLFTIILLQKQEFSATLIRGTGNQFAIEDLNVIRNQLKLRITNRRNSLQSYSIQVISEGVAIAGDLDSIEIESGKTKVIVFSASAPFEKFSNGRYPIQFEIDDKLGGHQVLDFKLLGPKRLPRRQTTTN